MYRPSYVPECKKGKGGRYFAWCHDHKTGRQFRIGQHLTKQAAIDCANACDLSATVGVHTDDFAVIHRNARAQEFYERTHPPTE